eukprot:CCRYP_006460-RA/>CCRYP_006460-RA protein AED:0.02 eAED:0.02 QI:124/1/1/1/0.5/0.33/3/814/441
MAHKFVLSHFRAVSPRSRRLVLMRDAFPRSNFTRKSLHHVLALVVVTAVVMLHNSTSNVVTMNTSASATTLFGTSLSSEAHASQDSTETTSHSSSSRGKTKTENWEDEGERREKRTRRPTSSNDTIGIIRNGAVSRPKYSKIGAGYSKLINTKKLVLPNVLLIGAQKAGTSAVADWLYHNGVCKAKIFDGEPTHYEKEVHFFDEDVRYHEGVEFYSHRFEHCAGKTRKKYILDATPRYLLFSKRIHDVYNQALQGGFKKKLKLIVVLREPISREVSWYNHRTYRLALMNSTDQIHESYRDILYTNGTIMSFDEYSETVLKESITENPLNSPGIYSEHLKSWANLFGRKRILVLSYDELQSKPSKARWRINRFLGTKYKGGFNKSNTKESDNKIRDISIRAREALEPLFKEMNEELYKFLRDHPGPQMEQNPFPRFKKIGLL